MKNKILLILIMSMFLVSLVSAECSIETVERGTTIDLYQSCTNCTQVNLTTIIDPNNQAVLLGQFEMSANGSNYNYTFSDTNTLGTYVYYSEGDLNGIKFSQPCSFEVTPSGNSGNANMVFFILIIFLLYGITLLGFLNENVMITVLGGMALMFLGVYMINNGIIIYQDNLTNAIAYITGLIGAMVSMFALYKEYFDN